MSENNHDSRNFLIGTLIGGLVGTAAALLLAPKTGCQLREQMLDKYNDVSDQIKDWDIFEREEEKSTSPHLLLGGLAGTILVAAAALLLSPKTGKTLRKGIAHQYNQLNGKKARAYLMGLSPFQKSGRKKSSLFQRRR